MTFTTKQDLISYIAHKFGITLQNEPTDRLNRHSNILYTRIPKSSRNAILSDFKKHGIQTNEHLDGYYWIYIN